MALQTLALKHLRLDQACADGEQGPLSERADISNQFTAEVEDIVKIIFSLTYIAFFSLLPTCGKVYQCYGS